MRGPLTSLWNTRLFGTWLRLLFGFVVASVVAVGGAALALQIGGVVGVLALLGLVLVGLVLVRLVLVFAQG